MTIFRILGPIEAWNGERQLAVGGPRQLQLLAFLLLHANRAVPRDALIDALWGAARTGADNRLQMSIARLRKALAPLDGAGAPVLRTVSGGYLLSVGPGQLDAEVFAELVRDGRRALDSGEPELAARTLRAALDMWREPVLAEVGFENFAQGEIRRLEDTRLAALEARVDADLQLGRHRELIGELEALLRTHKLNERFAAQLMLALYRSQRQTEALEVFQRIRVQLDTELGLAPGAALRALQAEILAQAPTLDDTPHVLEGTRAPARGPQAVDSTSAPLPSRLEPYGPQVFVDRGFEHQALSEAVRLTAAGTRHAAFVTGEPGIGKTRLVSEVAREAHASGSLVLAGRCDEGLDVPYQPFVEALEHLVEHAPQELLEDHVSRYGDSLARVVPALVSRVFDEPATMPPASESERYVLYRAVEGLLAAAGTGRSLLLVLEDLQWADLPTLKLLRALLASPRRSPVMLLCTCRINELGEEHPLRELLADLHREPHMLRLELGGLGANDVVGLMRGIDDRLATADEAFVAALQAGTNGNPFFITELVRGLLETGAVTIHGGQWQMAVGDDPASRLPRSITETLSRRLRRLDDDVRACLRAAAVIGDEFDLDVIAELVDDDRAPDALGVAVHSGMLLEMSNGGTRFRFAHKLMQRYLYNELGAGRRAELHRRAALVIEARLDEGRWPTAELARHWLAAGDRDAQRTLRHAVSAGDEALAKLAPDEALRWYRIALELLGRQRKVTEAEVTELLIRRGEAERQAGDRSFRNTLLEAAQRARLAGDDRALIRAALANTRGMQSETGIVDEERIAMLDAALSAVGDRDSPQRARLLAMQAAEMMYSPERERRTQLTDEALAIARRLDDPDALSSVLNLRFVTLLAPDTLVERTANTAEGIEAAEQLDDPLSRFFAYHWRGYASIESGDTDTARAWVTQEREIADQFRQPTPLWLARADEANLEIIAGRLEAADRLASNAFELGRHSEPDAFACYAAQRTSIAFESGRIGEMIPLLERAVEENQGVPGFRATLALALCETLRLEEAQAILDQAAASSFDDIPKDVTWLTVACIYAHVSATLGSIPAARALYERLKPWCDQIAYPAFGVWGPVSLYLGSLALAIGERATAERHFSEAAGTAARAQAPIWQARAARGLERLG